MSPTLLLMLTFVLPLVGAIFAFLFSGRSSELLVSYGVQALSGAVGLFGVVWYFLLLGANGTALPIMQIGTLVFEVTMLQAFFLGIVYLGVLLTSIYNIGALAQYRGAYSFPWLSLTSALFVIGMAGTVMAGNAFTFLVCWEVMSVAAYFLVIADREDDSLAAGFLYFIMTQIGYLSLLAGFLLLTSGYVFSPWSDVALISAAQSPMILGTAFLLLFIGFGSKAGLVPMHQWLPYAHPQAPSGSSALLSGVMLNVALFGFILVLGLMPILGIEAALTVIVAGLLSALFGAMHAAVERDMKKLLAWSSIENMGLLFTGIGIYMALHLLPMTQNLNAILSGVELFIVLHIINHFLFKTGLFMAAGAVVSATHTRELDDLGGLARTMPFLSGLFLVLTLAGAALPPFGTFFGEWAIMQSLALALAELPFTYAVAAGIILAVFALVAGLATFAFVKMFSAIFLGKARTEPDDEEIHAHEPSAYVTVPLFVQAVLLTFSGATLLPFFAHLGFRFEPQVFFTDVSLAAGASLNAWVIYALCFIAAGVIYLGSKLYRVHVSVRVTDTWDCGQELTPRMEYTATGFAAPIRFFFRLFVMAKKEMIAEPVNVSNPWISRKRLMWSTDSFWEVWLYRPVARGILFVAAFVKRLQSGIIQVYVVWLVLALMVVLYLAL